MTSSILWIDFDVSERDRAQRILDLFTEKDTRDELGLGAIRDSIADLLFPGTSTIQTRLRYMLFVPWLFMQAAGGGGGGRQALERSRGLEIALIEALKRGTPDSGVIGRDAGAALKRLPSDVYWAGLLNWGVRRLPGSQQDFLAQTARRALDAPPAWAPGLPPAPADLLERANFALSAEESAFLTDRLAASCPGSVLAELALSRDATESDAIWLHPGLGGFSTPIRGLIRHAEVFSQLMHGASLLYNLMLAEKRGREDWIEAWRERLDTWTETVDPVAITHWHLDDFWAQTRHEAHMVRPALTRFVVEWRDMAIAMHGGIADHAPARALIETREVRLKGAQSRLRNRAALDRWGGASGAGALTFRWGVAQRHLKDLVDAA